VAEGFILIVCASLPTLGPLFRVAKSKLTDGNGTEQTSGNNFEGSHRMSAGGSRDWDTFKGHKLDSDIGEPDQSSLHLRPSFDAIPLVTAAKKSSGFGRDAEGSKRNQKPGIHKTMEISVTSSECFAEKRQRQHGASAL
jgi:hypothetical protein